MTKTPSQTLLSIGAIADPGSVTRLGGRHIDTANLPNSYKDAQGDSVVPAFTAVVEDPATNLILPAVTATYANVTGVMETNWRSNGTYSAPGILGEAILYENLMPQATGSPKALPSALKTALMALGFKFIQYKDNIS